MTFEPTSARVGVYTSGGCCPIHRRRLERRFGSSLWSCPEPRCEFVDPVCVRPEWKAHLAARGCLKEAHVR